MTLLTRAPVLIRTSVVTHTASGGDYQGLTATITITATDNESSRQLFSRNSLAETVPSFLPFAPGQIPGLALWLEANRYKAFPDGGRPGLSDILAAQEGRESGELFAVTGWDGEVDLLSLLYPLLFWAKRVLMTLENSRKW